MIVNTLQPPLGVGQHATMRDVKAFVRRLVLKTVQTDRLTFEHVLFAIVSRIAEVPLCNNNAVHDLQQKLRKYFLSVRRG